MKRAYTPLCILVLTATLLAGTAAAQTQYVVIGGDDVTTGENEANPISDEYKYFRYQMVYSAAELSNAGMPAGASINALGFSVASDNGAAIATYTIRMAHTADVHSAAHDTTALTTVFGPASYTAVATAEGAQDMIYFSSPFIWNGTDNIRVDICSGSTAMPYASPYGAVRGATLTYGARFMRHNSLPCCDLTTYNTISFRPQIRFDHSGGTPCSGTPVPGNTTGPSIICAGADFYLGLTNATIGSGLSHQWYVSTNSNTGPWTPVGTDATYNTSQTMQSWYYCEVTCATGSMAPSGVLQVDMQYPMICNRCIPAAVGYRVDPICSVRFGSMSNSTCTTQDCDAGYMDYTGTIPAPLVLQNMSYTLSVTGSTNGLITDYFTAFFDWDQDGTFEDVKPIGSIYNDACTTIKTLNVTIPPISTGLTLMRILKNHYNPTNPCGNLSGQAEDYYIDVQQASCTPPAAAVTLTPDCVLGQFSMNVNLTSLGDAPNVDIVENVNDGGDVVVHDDVSAPANYTTGPYPMGAVVNIKVLHNGDAICDIGFGNFTYLASSCPLANDNCGDAIALTVNPDQTCDVITGGTLQSATASPDVNPCNGTANNDVWFSFVAISTSHRISLLNVAPSTSMTHAVYSGSCGALVNLNCNNSNLSVVSGLTIGDTYLVRVYSYAPGAVSTTFNVCIDTPLPPPANDNCGTPAPLTVNPDLNCVTVTAGTLESATASPESNPCAGTANDDVWFSFVATSTSHRVSLLNVSPPTGMRFGVYGGTCGALTSLGCSNDPTTKMSGFMIGDTYLVRVYSSSNMPFSRTTFNVCIGTPPPPPANDNCGGAYSLTVNPDYSFGSITAGSLASATASPENAYACYGTENDDVWFSFVATSTTHRIDLFNITGSTTDLYHSLWTGGCGSLTLVPGTCSDPETSNPAGLTIGQTYFLRVYSDGFVAQTTSFDVCIGTTPPPPPNDLCANAIPVGPNSVTPGYTSGGTNLGNPGYCTMSLTSGPGVWYTVQGMCGADMTASTCTNTPIDTRIGVFTGSCGWFTCVAGNDDFCGSGSSVTWPTSQGITYYVYVSAQGTGTFGPFTLTLSSTGVDTDGDGMGDVCDGCPTDPLKIEPGICGCGVEDIVTTWYEDADNDNFGDPLVSQPGYTCIQPTGYVEDSSDNCPTDPLKIDPGFCGCGTPDVPMTWYADADDDGFGDPLVSQPGYTCIQPSGYVADNSDNCPADPLKIDPGFCGCGTVDVPTTWYADADNDGFGDPLVSQPGYTCIQPPGYVEDNSDNCPTDPLKIEPGVCGCSTADVPTTWYADADDDGFGDPLVNQSGYTCIQPPGYVADNSDNCPTDPYKIDPGFCGCGTADVAMIWYADTDNDGFGDPLVSQPGHTCIQPPGYVADNTDNCPTDPLKVDPGFCGCGTVDVPTTWYADTDSDGFGDPLVNQSGYTCIQPPGYVADNSDNCPDDPDKIEPGVCGCGVGDITTIWYADTDNDGFGDPLVSQPGYTCIQPTGYVEDSSDNCPDDLLKTEPGVCGCGTADVPTIWYADTDNDGFGDPLVSQPGYTCIQPTGYVEDSSDNCPDDINKTQPGACGCGTADVPTTWYADTDNDGFGDPLVNQVGYTCIQPPGYVADNSDNCPGDINKTEPGACGCNSLEPGATCDDGDALTINDVIDANCNCVGTPLINDCIGVPGGPALPGTPCDDLDACTTGDVFDANCICVGTAVNVDDGDPCTLDICDPINGPSHVFQDADNDGTCDAQDLCPNDPNKIAPGNCGCGNSEPGTSCNDGDPNTSGDVIQANCQCAGTPTGSCIGNQVVVEINTDGNADQITWEIINAGNTVIASGGPSSGQNNTLVGETVCLGSVATSACYGFRLMDSFGDGITNGGWELRTTNGKLLLRDDFADGHFSPSDSPLNPNYTQHSFCLPTGPTNIAPTECGIFNNALGNKVYATKVIGAAHYQFEFSDPDAGFIRRIARPYNYIHFWDMVTTPLIPGVKYFARVRTDRDGPMLEAHFGSGCEMGLGLPQVVTCTQLISAPAYGHSCGETRTFNTNNSFIYAKPVQGANQYQFRLINTQEGYDQTFIRSTYILQLKWNNTVAPPLIDGYTYAVELNVRVNSLYSGFCASQCNITIDNSGNRPEASIVQAMGAVTLWPNPIRNGQVTLNIDGLVDAEQNITVDIQNIYGKLVFAKEFGNSGEHFNTILQLTNELASGVYMVNITVNGERTVERLSIIR